MMVRRLFKQYIDGLVVKREKCLVDRLALHAAGLFRGGYLAERRRSLSDITNKRRVAVVSPSDNDLDLARRLKWGDTWAKYELVKALGTLGYAVTDIAPDVVIHLYGVPARVSSGMFNVLWIYSNPNTITPAVLRAYDRIYCLSSSFTRKIKEMGFHAEYLPGATSKRPVKTEILHDVVFVGNARTEEGGRKIIRDLGEVDYDLKVWGRGWENTLKSSQLGGEFVDYGALSHLYASAKISLCDHRPEMSAHGFASLRIFDILASGGFCISDENPGVTEIFGDTVPQYTSAEHLRELVAYYVAHRNERNKLADTGREIAISCTWDSVVQRLLSFSDI